MSSMSFLFWSNFPSFRSSVIWFWSGGARPFILYSSEEFLHPYRPYTKKPTNIHTENLIQVCQESFKVRKMLIRTEAAGSQGTRGTAKGSGDGSWGCLATMMREMIILIVMRTSMNLWLPCIAMMEKGMHKMVNMIAECWATWEERGVGEITLSRLKHCLRYSFLVNTIVLEVLELQGNSSSSESFKSLVESGVYEQKVADW